jgi:hypothetical protein
LAVRTEDGTDLAGLVLPARPPRAVPPAGTWLTPFGEVRALVSATARVAPSFGHAESGATAPLVARIGRSASGTIDP